MGMPASRAKTAVIIASDRQLPALASKASAAVRVVSASYSSCSSPRV